VAAELNNGIPGIGALAYLSGPELDTPLTLACIFVIGIAALLLDGIIVGITRLLTPWVGKA
jgi:taurine transport system permease protein